MLRVIWFVHTHASLPVNMNPELSVLVERCPHIQDVTCRASGSTRAFNTDKIQLNMNCITYSDIQTHAMTQPQVQKPLVSIIGGNYFLYDLLVSQAAVEEFGPPLDAGGPLSVNSSFKVPSQYFMWRFMWRSGLWATAFCYRFCPVEELLFCSRCTSMNSILNMLTEAFAVWLWMNLLGLLGSVTILNLSTHE